MISPLILEKIVCPVTKRKLVMLNLTKDVVSQYVIDKNITYESGEMPNLDFDCVLLEQDTKRAYFVYDGIPVLLFEKSVILSDIPLSV